MDMKDQPRRLGSAGPAGSDGADLVLQLHDALLPKSLPVVPGVEVSARYLIVDARVGGDWFDAIPLGDGRVAVGVGDVVGEGVEASAAMGALRTVFDDRVRDDGDLVAALRAMERRARRNPEARAATICAALLDPATGDLRYCTAGHPPPIVVDRTGRAAYLPASGGVPLGSGSGDFPMIARRLERDELLLVYSDGLLERPGRTPDEGADELLRTVSDAVKADGGGEEVGDGVCDRILAALAAATGYDDDATLLALRLVEPVGPLQLTLPAIPDTVRAARADLGDWLAGLHVGVLHDLSVRHAVGELVTNAVEHAYEHPGLRDEVRITGVLGADGLLEVQVADDGQWRVQADVPRNRGRGLALVRGFMDELALERSEHGTRVTIRHLLTRPAAMLRGVPAQPDEGPGARHFGLAVDGRLLVLTGDVDHEAATELRRVLVLTSQGGTLALEVDLTLVRLLSSAGVQVLMDARAQGSVLLVAPPGCPARQVLDLVGMTEDL